MRTYIVDNGSHYLPELISLLESYNPDVVTIGSLKVSDMDSDSFVILSGGHTVPVLWHKDNFKEELDIIKKHSGPVLGICLGSQLIAHAYGAHLHLLENRRKGILEIQATERSTLLLPNEICEVYENHNWSVRDVKPPLIALAESIDGIEVFKHQHRPMYGLQFHPEHENKHKSKILYDRIFKELGV